jgi:hypothetical protein
MKSYHQTFGAPQGAPLEVVEEILMEILEALGTDFEAPEDVLYEKFRAVLQNAESYNNLLIDTGELSQNDKAHILDQAIDFANESFYELEDEGIDSDMAERNFLNALRRALSDSHGCEL